MNLFESNNLRRLVTGTSFGLALPYFLYPLLSSKSLEPMSEPIIKLSRDVYLPILLSSLLGGLFYWGQPSQLVLDSFIIIMILVWFSLCASFLFSFIRLTPIKWGLSIAGGIAFLSSLSLLHAWVLSFTI